MLRKEKIKTLPDQIHYNQHFIVMFVFSWFHDGGFHDTYSHQKCLSAPVSTHHEGVFIDSTVCACVINVFVSNKLLLVMFLKKEHLLICRSIYMLVTSRLHLALFN